MLIRLYPGLTRPALRKGYSNALAFWYLARAVDTDGSGHVRLSEIRDACPWWNEDKWYRAIRAFNQYQFGKVYKRGIDGEKFVKLVSLVKVAALLDIRHLGARAVMLDAEVLAKSVTFRAASFAAFHAGRSGHNENPISRKVLTELTGVARPTQLRYERKEKIQKRKNYLELRLSPDHLTWEKDNIHPGCFIGRDNTVCRPLPNSYNAPHDTTGKRPLRKRNHHLARLISNAVGLERALMGRLFYAETKAAERGLRYGKNTGRGKPSAFEPKHPKLAMVKSEVSGRWIVV